jgi:hypothetical protein
MPAAEVLPIASLRYGRHFRNAVARGLLACAARVSARGGGLILDWHHLEPKGAEHGFQANWPQPLLLLAGASQDVHR